MPSDQTQRPPSAGSRPARGPKIAALPLAAAILSLGLAGRAPAQDVHYPYEVGPPPPGRQSPPPSFIQICSMCHGNDARGTDRAPSLVHNPQLLGLSDSQIGDIISKGKGKMPAFPLPSADIQRLSRFIRLLNLSGAAPTATGSPAAGERFFFGQGQCASCHTVRGAGHSYGPDLTDLAGRLTLGEIRGELDHPGAAPGRPYEHMVVTLNDGSVLDGLVRARGSHDIVLQTREGRLRLLGDEDYRSAEIDPRPVMPAFQGTDEQRQDLLAYLTRLDGVSPGPLATPGAPPTPADMEEIDHPPKGDWPSYNGTLDGNRLSPLDQINRGNAGSLQLQWLYPIAFSGLETTPVVVDGIMYVTGNNQVFALSGRTGREIWRYQRPKSVGAKISGDAAIGVNRGVAVLGGRVFYLTDDAHLIALDRLTGTLLWDVPSFGPDDKGSYGGTSAPLVAGGLVITGVSGGDNGIRGFVAAFHPESGQLAWKFYTIPKMDDTGPVRDTWKGSALAEGGGATWLSGAVDNRAGVVYWASGNPHPDTDGDDRLGDNLYTDCDLALDLKTGKLLWYYQYTPHDLHDWDANEPIVLVDDKWRGQPRKLLIHANRNGFFYVLDRESGRPLLATKMVDKLTWASGIDPKTWRPDLLPNNEVDSQGVKTAPAVRGATNWYSTAYDPATHLFYVMTVEDYTIYRKSEEGGYGRYNNPLDPAKKIVRAIDIDTGRVAWQIDLPGPAQMNYSGDLCTAGGLLFFGESSGGFAAVDDRTGRYLWHFETNAPFKGCPMSYAVDGRQYVAIAAGANILSFALPAQASERSP